MFSEDDLQPISALQHLEFCERQWGLIHLEQIWEENRLTAEGRVLHERSDGGEYETRHGVRTARSLQIQSLRLGLSGRADVVEFHLVGPESNGTNATQREQCGLPPGSWVAYPIEFKRGKPKRDRCDEVQLCAQAMCLEEMLGVTVPKGAFFYGQTRHRLEMELTADLRAYTEELASRLHELFDARATPKPIHQPKCKNCSLNDRCLPAALGRKRRVHDYLSRALKACDDATGPEGDCR